MKPTILAILMGFGLATCAYAVEPQDQVQQGQKLTPRQERCTAKINIAHWVLVNRDKYSEKEVLELLAQDWQEYKQNPAFEYHVYVDMQRLVRDIYRKSGKEYKISNETKEDINTFVEQEAQLCMWYQGF